MDNGAIGTNKISRTRKRINSACDIYCSLDKRRWLGRVSALPVSLLSGVSMLTNFRRYFGWRLPWREMASL